MARPLRLEFENAVYHITARGNERKELFIDRRDCEKFLFYLGVVQERYKVIIYCYVLMNNHYHLLIETPQPNLSRIMRDLNGHYTIYFNKRHKRAGHLFQGRYNSILVDKDNYLLELSRYIHLNPVRAGLVQRPQDYKYNSLHYYIAKRTAPLWLNVHFILEQFGKKVQDQQNAYRKFVYESLGSSNNPLQDVYLNTILGSEDFINKIKDTFLHKKQISKEIPYSKSLQFGKNLNDIAELVVKFYGLDKEVLNKRKLKFNRAKKVFVYLSRKYTATTLEQIKSFLNNSITEVAISKLFSRTQEELAKEKDLRKDIEKIGMQLCGEHSMYQVKT